MVRVNYAVHLKPAGKIQSLVESVWGEHPSGAKQSGRKWGMVAKESFFFIMCQDCCGQGLVFGEKGVIYQDTGRAREVPLHLHIFFCQNHLWY